MRPTGAVRRGGSLLGEIVRDGARAMLAAALRAEVTAYIDAHAGEVDENGYRLVVRDGFHGEREVLTAAGAVPVRAPRVNDKRVDVETGETSPVLLGDPAGVGAEVSAGVATSSAANRLGGAVADVIMCLLLGDASGAAAESAGYDPTPGSGTSRRR